MTGMFNDMYIRYLLNRLVTLVWDDTIITYYYQSHLHTFKLRCMKSTPLKLAETKISSLRISTVIISCKYVLLVALRRKPLICPVRIHGRLLNRRLWKIKQGEINWMVEERTKKRRKRGTRENNDQ